MQDQPGEPAATAPRKSSTPAPAAEPAVDKFPKSREEWGAFAALPAVERSAVYLRSIRGMLVFFTVLTVIGIAAAFILGMMGIHAIDQNNATTSNPFG